MKNNINDTVYLSKEKRVKEEILNGKNTPLSECVSADEVDWAKNNSGQTN